MENQKQTLKDSLYRNGFTIYPGKSKSVRFINNTVVKKYKHAKKEGEIIKILNSYSKDGIQTPKIINIENEMIIMEKLKGSNINWRTNKKTYILNYIGRAGELLGKLHSIENNFLNKYLDREESNIQDFIEKKFQLYISDYGGNYINESEKINIKNKFQTIFSSTSNFSSDIGFCHGDYCYQNVLNHNNSCYLIDFENSYIGYQVDDIARYLSKVLLLTIEINNIDFELFEKIFIEHYKKYHSFNYETYRILLFIYLLNIRLPLTLSLSNIYKFPRIFINRKNYNQLIKNYFIDFCSN